MSFMLFMIQHLSDSLTYKICAGHAILDANTSVATLPESPQYATIPALEAPDMISNVVLQTAYPLQPTATTATISRTISTADAVRLAIMVAVLAFWAVWLSMPKLRTQAAIPLLSQDAAANADDSAKAPSTTTEELFAHVVRLQAQQVQQTADLWQLMHTLLQNQDALAAQMKKNVVLMAQEVKDMRREMPELANESRSMLKDTLAWVKDVHDQNDKAEKKMRGVPEGVRHIEQVLHEQLEMLD